MITRRATIAALAGLAATRAARAGVGRASLQRECKEIPLRPYGGVKFLSFECCDARVSLFHATVIARPCNSRALLLNPQYDGTANRGEDACTRSIPCVARAIATRSGWLWRSSTC